MKRPRDHLSRCVVAVTLLLSSYLLTLPAPTTQAQAAGEQARQYEREVDPGLGLRESGKLRKAICEFQTAAKLEAKAWAPRLRNYQAKEVFENIWQLKGGERAA